MSNKLGHFQNAGSTPVVGRWLPNPDSLWPCSAETKPHRSGGPRTGAREPLASIPQGSLSSAHPTRMQIRSGFPQHPERLHLQRKIYSPCPTPHRQPGVGTQGTPAHKNRATTRLAPPRGRVTIPLSSKTGWTGGPGTSARSPMSRRAPGAQPPARERAAHARAKATLADRVSSPDSGSAPLLLAGGGGGPPPLGPTL